MSVVIHIAGPVVTAGSLRRQRCCWCGALIDEYDLANVARPLEPGENPENLEPWAPAQWEVGDHVLVDGGMKTVVELEAVIDDDGHTAFKIDGRACMSIDNAVTA